MKLKRMADTLGIPNNLPETRVGYTDKVGWVTELALTVLNSEQNLLAAEASQSRPGNATHLDVVTRARLTLRDRQVRKASPIFRWTL